MSSDFISGLSGDKELSCSQFIQEMVSVTGALLH